MLRVVLLGKSSAGKSATGNSLLGGDVFAESKTSALTWATRGELEVFDTPALGEESDHKHVALLAKELRRISGGVNAFILVINVVAPTLDSTLCDALQLLEATFSKAFWAHMCILFTHCDEKEEDMWIANVHRCKEMCGVLGRRFGIPAPRSFFVSNLHEGVGEWSNLEKFVEDSSKGANVTSIELLQYSDKLLTSVNYL